MISQRGRQPQGRGTSVLLGNFFAGDCKKMKEMGRFRDP